MKFSDEHLRDLAGERAFERGAHCARRGRVVIESCTPTSIRAVVSSTEDYDVRIGQKGAEPDWHRHLVVGTAVGVIVRPSTA